MPFHEGCEVVMPGVRELVEELTIGVHVDGGHTPGDLAGCAAFLLLLGTRRANQSAPRSGESAQGGGAVGEHLGAHLTKSWSGWVATVRGLRDPGEVVLCMS